MCGRYASTSPPEFIARLFGTEGTVPNAAASWNVAPRQDAMVVRRHPESGARRLDLLNWGLVPHWTRDPGQARRPINVRAETVATTPMFRESFRHRRCLVPADAFYEWQARENAPKQPFAVARCDGAAMAFAGLWEGWRGADGTVLRSFAIIVTEANAEMAPVHDRMPVIIEPADWPGWLGETGTDPQGLLRPAAVGVLRIWPVSRRVNRPANNDAALLEAVTLEGS